MHFKSVIVALLTTRINCWTTTPTTQDRRAIITKLVTLPVLVAPLIANADDPSLFDQEIYNPNAPTANQKAVDMKRSSAPPPSRSSKPKESKEQVDPYSEEAVRAKRAKANGLWGGGGSKAKKGSTLAEQVGRGR